MLLKKIILDIKAVYFLLDYITISFDLLAGITLTIILTISLFLFLLDILFIIKHDLTFCFLDTMNLLRMKSSLVFSELLIQDCVYLIIENEIFYSS